MNFLKTKTRKKVSLFIAMLLIVQLFAYGVPGTFAADTDITAGNEEAVGEGGLSEEPQNDGSGSGGEIVEDDENEENDEIVEDDEIDKNDKNDENSEPGSGGGDSETEGSDIEDPDTEIEDPDTEDPDTEIEDLDIVDQDTEAKTDLAIVYPDNEYPVMAKLAIYAVTGVENFAIMLSGMSDSVDIKNNIEVYPKASNLAEDTAAGDAFDYIYLSVSSPDSDGELFFTLSAALNSIYLEYFQSKSNVEDLPKIYFEFDISLKTLINDNPNGPTLDFDSTKVNLKDGDDIVGFMDIIVDKAASKMTVRVELYNDAVYGSLTFGCNANFYAEINKETIEESTPEITFDENKLMVQVNWKSEIVQPDKDPSGYEVTKEVDTRTEDSPYLDYTITIAADEGKDLSGTKLVDILAGIAGDYGLILLGFDYKITYEITSNGTTEEKDASKSFDANNLGEYLYLYEDGLNYYGDFDPFNNTLTKYSVYYNDFPGLVFIFDIPPASETNIPDGARITKVELNLNTMIDQAAYEKLMAANSLELKVKNKAALYFKTKDGIDKEISAEKDATVKLSFLEKSGVRYQTSNSQTLKWTITGNTYFIADNDYVYIVDSIDATQHQYVTNSNDEIEISLTLGDNQTPVTINAVKHTEATGLSSYNSLNSVENIWKLLSSGSAPNALWYRLEDEYILIIRLEGDELNKPFKIEYFTKLNYADIGYEGIKLINKAKLILPEGKIGYGPGPGTGYLKPGGNIEKGVDVESDIVSKAGRSYIQNDDQKLTWRITLNNRGEEINNLKITDTFYANKQILRKIGDYKVTYDTTASPPTVALESVSVNNMCTIAGLGEMKYVDSGCTLENENWFSIAIDSSNNVILTLFFAEIEEEKGGYFDIVTQVVDPDILSKQGSDTAKNELEVLVDGDTNNPGSGTITAEYGITNTLIGKTVSDSDRYSFTDGTIKWTITVNRNKIGIKNPVITDKLPEGLELKTSENADGKKEIEVAINATPVDFIQSSVGSNEYKGSYNGKTATLKITPGDVNDVNDIIELKFDDSDFAINTTMTLKYTTVIKEDFKKININKVVAGILAEYSHTFENWCYLDGTVGLLGVDGKWDYADGNGKVIDEGEGEGANQSKTAKATADAKINIQPITKTGSNISYEEVEIGDLKQDLYLIHWEILLNRDQYQDIDGIKITDDVTNYLNGNQITAMNLDSLKVYTVTLNAGGTINGASKTLIDGWDYYIDDSSNTGFTSISEEGFVYEPHDDNLKDKVILIEYDVIIQPTDVIIRPADINNQLIVTGYKTNETQISVPVNKESIKLRVEANAWRSYPYNIKIAKASSNTLFNTNYLPLHKLSDVKFTLQGYAKWNVGASTVNESSKIYSNGRTVTTNNGVAEFAFIRPDVIYELEETGSTGDASHDYTLNANSKIYFVVPVVKGVYPDTISGKTLYRINIDSGTVLTVDENGDITAKGSAGNDVGKTIVFLNEPKKNLEFTKEDELGDPLDGIEFKLTLNPGSVPTGLNVDLLTRYATSGSDGKAEFKNLDPGTYTLEEYNNTREPYNLVGSFTVNIPQGNDEITIDRKTGVSGAVGSATISGSETEGFTITNYVNRGNIEIRKIDPSDGEELTGAVFGVYLIKLPEGAVLNTKIEDPDNTPVAYVTDSNVDGVYRLSDSHNGESVTPCEVTVDGKTFPLFKYHSDEDGWLLYPGEYYLREIVVPYGYVAENDKGRPLNETDSESTINSETTINKYDFTITAGKTNRDYADDKAINNYSKEYSNNHTIIGYKWGSSVDGRPLADALIGLFQYDETVFTEINTLKTAITDSDGKFEFADVPYGEYIVREITPPRGYTLNRTVWKVIVKYDNPRDYVNAEVTVELDEDGNTINIVNRRIDDGGGDPPITPPKEDDKKKEEEKEKGGDEDDNKGGGEDDNGNGGGDEDDDDGDEDGETEPPSSENVPTIEEVDQTEIIRPEQLPEGYSVVQYDDNTYIIYDEDGIPLGYVIVPEGMTLDDINILEEMIPFGAPEVTKPNPKTGDIMKDMSFVLPALAITLAAVFALIVLLKRRRKLSER